MNTPPHYSEWIALPEAAKGMQISMRKMHKCRKGLVRSVTGSEVQLAAWRTPVGWVTTEAALKEFVQRLNM